MGVVKKKAAPKKAKKAKKDADREAVASATSKPAVKKPSTEKVVKKKVVKKKAAPKMAKKAKKDADREAVAAKKVVANEVILKEKAVSAKMVVRDVDRDAVHIFVES